MSKEAYYFSHDSNARYDPKISAMRRKYGLQGYGLYWVIIEMMREEDGFKLAKKEYIFDAIGEHLQCKSNANAMQNDSQNFTEYAKQFCMDCIKKYDLFVEDDHYFWSESLLKRMDKKKDVSEKRRNAARARWEKDANAMQNNANAMQDDAIKEKKEKKEKKIKENKETTTTENPFDFYQQNFGVLSPYMGEQIGQWIDDLNECLVIEAMKITLTAGKKWNYANGILKDWHRNNVTTVDEARALNKPEGKNKGDKWEGLE